MQGSIKMKNLANHESFWFSDEAIARSVPANGPHGTCVAVLPEDWPADAGEFSDESNIWLLHENAEDQPAENEPYEIYFSQVLTDAYDRGDDEFLSGGPGPETHGEMDELLDRYETLADAARGADNGHGVYTVWTGEKEIGYLVSIHAPTFGQRVWYYPHEGTQCSADLLDATADQLTDAHKHGTGVVDLLDADDVKPDDCGQADESWYIAELAGRFVCWSDAAHDQDPQWCDTREEAEAVWEAAAETERECRVDEE
jgi:hypothetical protein